MNNIAEIKAGAIIGKKPYWSNVLPRIIKYKAFYIMAIPGIIYFLIFHYWPMYGIRIAFYEFGLLGLKGFIGLKNFRELFQSPVFHKVFFNTMIISTVNIITQLFAAIVISLLLNEILQLRFKKFVQTVIYLPHFLSWVITASIFYLFLSPEDGFANTIIEFFGGKPIHFLASPQWWRKTFWAIMIWKETGWGTIIFLAALSGIDPNLYESSSIDGATRLQQAWYITMPHLGPVIIIVLVMYLSKIFNIFESVFVLYNPLVYDVSDVIGTYVYRKGIIGGDYDYATAVGLFKSVISLVLVLGANELSKRIRQESIF